MKQDNLFSGRGLAIGVPVAFISLLFGMILSFVGTTYAQDTRSLGADSFAVFLKPEFPGPNQEVTAVVVSNLINADGSPITWILDGKTRLSGVGKKNFTFVTGEIGSPISLRVEVATSDFGVVAKDIRVQPSDVDVLWEANTYTPPFYKGKALPTSQSVIKVLGIPSFIVGGGKIDPQNLVYHWQKTYTPNPDDSGIGKNMYLFRGTYTFNDDTIETTVGTADGALSVSKKTKISIVEPKIVFYENKPLEDVRYEKALGGLFTVKEAEITLRAEPYFFSFQNANNNGGYFVWELDGKRLEVNPDKKSEFTFGKPPKGSGSANIRLEIENIGYDLQKAAKNISVSYTN